MDADNCRLACGLVSKSYISQGQQALVRRQRLVKALLSSRRLPDQGWDDDTIEMLIKDCALMDSNNFLDNVGVGEREARVASRLVAQRHYGLAHGIGRSGDVAAEQPKAAGSSLLAKLTNLLAADALRLAGLEDLGGVTVLPLATGMALTMTLLALRPSRPPAARYVIWSRIDQKTCLKAITAACLEPVVIQPLLVGDELQTDVPAIEAAVQRLGADAVVCVATTTSCFAPRAADDVVAVAKLCERLDVGHVINNAYGVQSAALCALVTSAWRKGRVDAVVQSTDKNFLVPVGGAVVAAGRRRPGLVAALNRSYPGRAAVAAHLDLLMTLLHWGAQGWRQVLREREELYPHLRQQLERVAAAVNARRAGLPSHSDGDPSSTPTPASMPGVPAGWEPTAAGGKASHHATCHSSQGEVVPSPDGGGCSSRFATAPAAAIAARSRLRVLSSPGNPISVALALDEASDEVGAAESGSVGPAQCTASRAAPNDDRTARAGCPTSSSCGPDVAPRQAATAAMAAESRTTGCFQGGSDVSNAPRAGGDAPDMTCGATTGCAATTATAIAERDDGAMFTGGGGGATAAPADVTAGVGATSADATAGGGATSAGATVGGSTRDTTFLGAMLWSRCISGTRVVPRGAVPQTIAGITFPGYGAHHDRYPVSFLTAAAAIGTSCAEVDEFARRLEACLMEYDNRRV